MTRRRILMGSILVVVVAIVGLVFYRPFPPDRTPEGAYARIAKAIAEGRSRDVFAYMEQDAQDACFTIRDQRKAAYDAALRDYPPGAEREALLETYRELATAPDGSDVFVLFANRRGWFGRLKKDLSGIRSVETAGERATVTTTQGTRYSFQRRPNGVWGLTLFTAELLAESEKSARDLSVVRAAAADYARYGTRSASRLDAAPHE